MPCYEVESRENIKKESSFSLPKEIRCLATLEKEYRLLMLYRVSVSRRRLDALLPCPAMVMRMPLSFVSVSRRRLDALLLSYHAKMESKRRGFQSPEGD